MRHMLDSWLATCTLTNHTLCFFFRHIPWFCVLDCCNRKQDALCFFPVALYRPAVFVPCASPKNYAKGQRIILTTTLASPTDMEHFGTYNIGGFSFKTMSLFMYSFFFPYNKYSCPKEPDSKNHIFICLEPSGTEPQRSWELRKKSSTAKRHLRFAVNFGTTQ